MLMYFVRNRHGVVTVFLIAILTAAMSFNTMFIEAARYRSMGRLFAELEQNAAFSALAHYDRDLYKNFGLLAVDDSVDGNMIRDYILYNANSLGGNSRLENFINDDCEVSMEELYDLAQDDVFMTQINEFCALRAPVALLENYTDFDDTINEFVSQFANSLTFIDSLDSVASKADTVLDAIQAMVDFKDKTENVFLPAIEGYKDSITSLNDAIDALSTLKSEHDDAIDNEEEVDEAAYQESLRSAIADIADAINSLIGSINTVSDALDEWYESFQDFKEKFDTMVNTDIKGSLEETKSAGDNAVEIGESMEESYDENEKELEDLINKVEKDGYAAGQAYTEAFINSLKTQMLDEIQTLKSHLSDPEYASSVTEIDFNPGGILEIIKNAQTKAIEEADKCLEEEKETIDSITEYLKLLKDIFTVNITYDDEYNSDIGGITADLPGHFGDKGKMRPAYNLFETEDKAYLDRFILRTQGVADELGYDLRVISDSDFGAGMNGLENAITSVQENIESFIDSAKSLKLTLDIRKTIKALKNIMISIKNLFQSCRLLVNEFARIIEDGAISTIVYKKLNPAVYATEMFTNRATDIDETSKMNGAPFREYSGEGAFKKASVEYIFAGENNEISNQTKVFWVIFALRLLANIPALLKDKALAEAADALTAVPYVGIVLAILLILIIWVLETYFDMVFMIYGANGIFLIKTTGYFNFSGQGARELVGQLTDLSDGRIRGKLKDYSGKLLDKSGAPATGKGFGGKGPRLLYKDHLFLILLLFTPGEKMYAREADLIQMQMAEETGTEYRLKNRPTYLRIDASASYKPVLPIPLIHGANSTGLKISKRYYVGY